MPLFLSTAVATGQTSAPLPVPDVPIGKAGTVSAIVQQPDGGLILGGHFTLIDGVPRRGLARLQPDGTLDMDWNPAVEGSVKAVAVDADNNVYVGGRFESVDGLPRRNLAKVSGTGRGAADSEWDPGSRTAAVTVDLLTLNAEGDLFVGGDVRLDDLSARPVVKFSGDGAGAVDPDWNPPLQEAAAVHALLADGNGAIYISVTESGGGCCLYKVSDSGGGGEVTGSRPALGGVPFSLARAADGSLYAGSPFPFSFENGEQRHLLRLGSDGGGRIDFTWDPALLQGVEALAIDAAGAVYASVGANEAEGSRLVKWTRASEGGAHTEWQIPSRDANALTAGADGSLYIGGHFDRGWEPAPGRLSLARVSAADASPLATVDALLPGAVHAIAFQADGAAIVAGDFDRVGTLPRDHLLRMTANGQLDPDWNPSPGYEAIYALAVDAENRVYAGGYTTSPLQPLPVVRLDGSGAIDLHWVPQGEWSGSIHALALDGRGGIYVGGDFWAIAEPLQRKVTKLSLHDAAPDATWNPPPAERSVRAIVVDDRDDAVYIAGGDDADPVAGPGDYIGSIAKLSNTSGSAQSGWVRPLPGVAHALAFASHGALYVGGHFLAEGATSAAYVVKFAPDGRQDERWNAMARMYGNSRFASALVLDSGDDVYVGGDYPGGNSLEGGPASSVFLTKLSGSTGSVVSDWSPSIDGGAIETIAMKSDGSLYLGGDFAAVGGQPRSALAALPAQASQTRPRTHSPRPLPPISGTRALRLQGVSTPATRPNER